jgi:hypothetical protein
MAFAVEHLCADGNAELHVVTGRTVLSGAAPLPSAAGPVPSLGAKSGQVAELSISDEHDVTPRAAVAAVGTATGNVLLAPEAERAVSTTAGDRGDAGAVVKHRPC